MRRPRSVRVPELRDRLGEIEVLHHGPVSGHEVLAGLFSRAGVPHAAVMDLTLTGDFVNAQQALAWGLVSRVVPATT